MKVSGHLWKGLNIAEHSWISVNITEIVWELLWTSMKISGHLGKSLNITENFWKLLFQLWNGLKTSVGALHRCKNIKINSCKVFFAIAGGILVFFTFFCSSKKSSDMESKENTDLGKITFLEFFRITHLKLLSNFRFLVSSASMLRKNHLFWLFSWSLPVCCLPVMFSAESEMFRNVHHWISYDQRCQN